MERPTIPTVLSADRGESPEDQHPSTTSLSPGDTVAGRYVVEERLGSGGMGVVVAARHASLGHRVALKLLSAASLADADAFTRFSREARIVASLESDHIVRVTDFGMHRGTPYMVMEVLAGRDLGSELAERGALPVEEAVDHVIEACDGLDVAHAKGIVHRDVKLANLFLSLRADGQQVVKVLDFGVSKLQSVEHDEPNLTRTTSTIGSPAYMSPEQIRDPRTVDARADVWSLGVVLYKLLAAAPPFEGLSASALCAAIAADPPTPLRSVAPQVPPRVETIVLRCLEKRPELRPPGVAALARELAAFASPRGRLLAEQIVRRAMESGTLDTASDIGAPAPPGPARRPRWTGFVIAAAVLAIAVPGVVVARAGMGTVASAGPPTPPVPSTIVDVAVAPSSVPPVASEPATPPAAVPARTRRRPAPAPTAAPRTSPAPSAGFGGSALDDHH